MTYLFQNFLSWGEKPAIPSTARVKYIRRAVPPGVVGVHVRRHQMVPTKGGNVITDHEFIRQTGSNLCVCGRPDSAHSSDILGEVAHLRRTIQDRDEWNAYLANQVSAQQLAVPRPLRPWFARRARRRLAP